MHDSFRLLSFNPYDAVCDDKDEGNNNVNKKEKEFLVQMFGINEKGQTASIFVEGYSPFFYVMVCDNWKEPEHSGFI